MIHPNLDPRLRAVRENFLERVANDVAELQRGVDGVRAGITLRILHSLKGAAGSCGFDELGTLAAELERSAKAGDHAQVAARVPELEEERLRCVETLAVAGDDVPALAEAPVESGSATAIASGTARIVCVEDDADIAMLVRCALSGDEFEVEVFDDGLAGWVRIAEEPPSAVLLDLMLPSLSGFEVLERIRSRADLADVPVVVLSARVLESEGDTALDMGATAFLPKPFDVDELESLVRELTSR